LPEAEEVTAMPGRHRGSGDRLTRALTTAGVVLTVAAVTTGARPVWDRVHSAPARHALPVTGTLPAAPTRPVPRPERAAPVRPVLVTVPAIGVRSSLVPLRLDRAGALVPPADFGQAGWYVGGPTPGDPGPAVIAGHVDSRAGPAIFFRLRDLRPGDTILVGRSDGRTARFRVAEVQRYPKNAFPTQRVYGPTPDRALRMITCGGSFDYARRSYRDNIVVYAVAG
jgi:hypothetical protein